MVVRLERIGLGLEQPQPSLVTRRGAASLWSERAISGIKDHPPGLFTQPRRPPNSRRSQLKVGIALAAIFVCTLIVTVKHQGGPVLGSRNWQPAARPVRLPNPPTQPLVTHQTLETRSASNQAESAQVMIGKVLGDTVSSDQEVRDLSPTLTLHRQSRDRATDPDWGPNAEDQLRGYITSRIDPAVFEIVHIACGSTVCEIQAANRNSTQPDVGGQTWDSMISDTADNPWWSAYGFTQPTTAQWTAPDGRVLMVSYLVRR